MEENICEYKNELKEEMFMKEKYLQCKKECPYENQNSRNFGQHEKFTFCKTNGLKKILEK